MPATVVQSPLTPLSTTGASQQPPPSVAQNTSHSAECLSDPLGDIPLSDLEQELRHLYNIALEVAAEVGAVIWPTDATLLGMMRSGRIMTDRDIDFQIHSTFDGCAPLLRSLQAPFEKRISVRMFKVVAAKVFLDDPATPGKKIKRKVGRYAMMRAHPKYGTFGTGVDFNCVYLDDPQRPLMHVHKGTLEHIPHDVIFPMRECLMYGRAVPCPRDGMGVFRLFAPRYDGCLTFPHCTGDPSTVVRQCTSPHPPLATFDRYLEAPRALDRCGFLSLASHFEEEPTCAPMLRRLKDEGPSRCEGPTVTPGQIKGAPICYLQPFKG
jgi:hypothetical protein